MKPYFEDDAISPLDEAEFVVRLPDGDIQPLDLPREIARKVAIYRRLEQLGFEWKEIVFLLRAETF